MRILLIEDEKELANSIVEYLVKDKQYNCDLALDFTTASELCAIYEYDCLIVDIGLPDGSGFDIIKNARNNGSKAGIIIISARDALDHRIDGLNLGADDYLVKPFHFSELNARIHSLIRRLKSDGNSELIFNEIFLDSQSRQVKVHNTPIEFTKSEYDLLYYLITNRNQVISKTSIAEHLVGEHVDILSSLDFVYLHIKNLRKKLTEAGCNDYIKTVYGVGYKFLIQ
ncbi:MAG: response regulator transcription factor [Bacteroidales bacterium]|nr:response regulator transcription factor [Bacteroidales bacterium]MCF8336455.1 response regulator transcription factor [Bacteroidales bacterium]